MTNRGVTKLIICLAVFALSLSMFFQSWFSINGPEWMGVVNDLLNSGKDKVTSLFGTGEDTSYKTADGGPVGIIKKAVSEWVGNRIDEIGKGFNFSPQKITWSSDFISSVTRIAIDTLNKISFINAVIKLDPSFFQKTAMLFSIWEYAIYIAAGIALASIIIDRTIGILPYVLLLCTYPMVVFWRLQKLVPFIQITRLITLTPYAIVSIATAIILLILSIAVRDKKRYALRREAKKMKRWMYL